MILHLEMNLGYVYAFINIFIRKKSMLMIENKKIQVETLPRNNCGMYLYVYINL